MDPQKKKKLTIIIALGCVAVIVAAFFVVRWLGPRLFSESNLSATGMTNVLFDRSAYDIALTRASSWQSDATLATMVTADNTGQRWNFTFVSLKAKGKGLTVLVDGQTVVSANEIFLSGHGAALPQNIILPDQAIVAAHAVPGYATSAIGSVELIYNAVAKQWYWGMKTDKNVTVTVKATP